VKVVLAGGTGALGRRLADAAAAHGDEVVVLTRAPHPGSAHRQVRWDGVTVGAWDEELADAVLINLAGELVDRRPTPANVALLTRSRVQPTEALKAAAAGATMPPRLWVQLSTLAIYGDAGESVLDESSPIGSEPAQMCCLCVGGSRGRGARGAASDPSAAAVLDRATPALDRLTAIARWGLGGRISTGQQWVSWLHIDDFLAIVDRVIADPDLIGIVHATSPNPVRNSALMRELRHAVHRPPAPPTPAWLVKLGAVVLRTDPALALTGRRAIPAKLNAVGHQFRYPDLPDALTELLAPQAYARSVANAQKLGP